MNYKQTIVAFIAVFIFTASTSVAVEIGTFGLKIGYSASYMRADQFQYERSELHSGIIGGPFINIDLSPYFIFQPAVVFAQRGGTYRDLSSSLSWNPYEVDELALRRDYLELPILFRFKFAQDSPLSPSLIGGLVWGWVLTSEDSEDGSKIQDPNSESDIAIEVGVGLSWMHYDLKLSLDVLYRRGMSGLRAPFRPDFFETDGIDVMLGIGF